MTGSPVRRIVSVLLVYAVVAWLVLSGASWLRRVLALPDLFEELLRAGLVAGVPVAIVVAWRYPTVGVTEGTDTRGDS